MRVLVGLNSHWNVDCVCLMKGIMSNNPIPFSDAILFLSAAAVNVNQFLPICLLLLATLRLTGCRR